MKIIGIQPFSPAASHPIEVGDQLVRLNGHTIRDVIDYQFYSAEESLDVELSRTGRHKVVRIEKGMDEELGLEVEPMRMRACANDCIFCFADQNPPDARDSLNFRDGDYRFSFLHGHFITMTNMGPAQLNRVIQQKLSPLYISIHVTDPGIRQNLMLYKKDDQVLEKIRQLTSNGINLHTQVVLCPGWNDGEVLRKTISDLFEFAPRLQSVSIVPVGLTRWREDLPAMENVTPEYARRFIREMAGWSEEFVQTDGSRFLYLSDEWFILADAELPPDSYYDDYMMVENGVGQCRDLANRVSALQGLLPPRLSRRTRLTFATGTLAHGFLQRTLSPLLDPIRNLEWELIPVRNDWLGADLVTVTGLLTGRDVVAQLKDRELGRVLYLSHRMFNEDGVTLDDMPVAGIAEKLGAEVRVHHEDLLEILEPWQ